MSKLSRYFKRPNDSNESTNKEMNKEIPKETTNREIVDKNMDQMWIERFQMANKLWHRCKWPECNYTSNRTDSIVRHLRKHTGDRPYRCHLCSYATIQSSALKIHMRRHTGEKPYVCKFENCDKRFTVLGTLLIHERTHTGIKPFRCPVDECNYAANDRSKLSTHMKKNHGLNSSQVLKNGSTVTTHQLIPINLFDTMSATPENIQIEVDVPHYSSERITIERPINPAIRISNREENSIKNVSQYVDKRLVNNKSVYYCKWEGCSYDTNRSDSIVRHIHSHTGNKPYKCDECDYKTVQRSALNQHMVWHTKDKPYKCQMCSYSTIKRNNLEIHIHKNHLTSLIIPNVDNDFKKIGKFVEKKRLNWFECKYGNGCTYGTVRKDAIVRHMKTHTDAKAYKKTDLQLIPVSITQT